MAPVSINALQRAEPTLVGKVVACSDLITTSSVLLMRSFILSCVSGIESLSSVLLVVGWSKSKVDEICLVASH